MFSKIQTNNDSSVAILIRRPPLSSAIQVAQISRLSTVKLRKIASNFWSFISPTKRIRLRRSQQHVTKCKNERKKNCMKKRKLRGLHEHISNSAQISVTGCRCDGQRSATTGLLHVRVYIRNYISWILYLHMYIIAPKTQKSAFVRVCTKREREMRVLDRFIFEQLQPSAIGHPTKRSGRAPT